MCTLFRLSRRRCHDGKCVRQFFKKTKCCHQSEWPQRDHYPAQWNDAQLLRRDWSLQMPTNQNDKNGYVCHTRCDCFRKERDLLHLYCDLYGLVFLWLVRRALLVAQKTISTNKSTSSFSVLLVPDLWMRLHSLLHWCLPYLFLASIVHDKIVRGIWRRYVTINAVNWLAHCQKKKLIL